MYTLCEVNGKTVVKCRDCNCKTSVSAKSDRLRNHKIKCGAVKKNTPYKSPLDILVMFRITLSGKQIGYVCEDVSSSSGSYEVFKA
jgi:hypothetical protein